MTNPPPVRVAVRRSRRTVEEIQLLEPRHRDVGVEIQIVVEARRPALEPADDDQVRQLRVAFAAAAPAALAVGGIALAGTGAHRLVGGVWKMGLGWRMRVGFRHGAG